MTGVVHRAAVLALLGAFAGTGVGFTQGVARPQEAARPVIVASKPFGESYLLAEMFAQLLEAHGIAVERRLGLGATEIAFGALRSGAIDVYPEYTGTGLLAILHERPSPDPRAVFAQVAREFESRFGVRWLPPLGFQNTYAIAVRRETAERAGLRTLSDLARAGPTLRAGLTPDFIGRDDGLPGLGRAYGLRFREVRALLPAVKYQALAAGQVDVIDGYATDGLIARYDLVVLEDDRGFFPPYEAAALVAPGLAERRPEAVSALTELSGRLSEATMRLLNRRVEVDNEPVARVARDALGTLGLLTRAAADTGARPPGKRSGLAAYLWAERRTLLGLTGRHVFLVVVSLAAAIAVALPLGLGLERLRGGAEAVIRAVGVLQTMPGIALLAFMIPVLGIGVVPALAALFLYSLYPILRNTYTGVRDAAPDAVSAATALGMTPRQVLRHVRLPLAAPLIMAGIRTAAVINVGTATLAAFIGAGGLGDPIASGLALSDTRMILSGALPAAALALLVDAALGVCERVVRPGGGEGGGRAGGRAGGQVGREAVRTFASLSRLVTLSAAKGACAEACPLRLAQGDELSLSSRRPPALAFARRPRIGCRSFHATVSFIRARRMRLHPFRAVRPASDLAERVAAVPYDVVSRTEAVALAEGNPYSFLHVGRSDIDLPADVNPYDARIYAKARETLDRFQAEGTLIREATPSLYLYRQIMDGRAQTGIVGCVHIDDYEQDIIRKHEKTRQDKEDDRTRHVLTLRANAEPVFLTYRARPEIEALTPPLLAGAPLYDFTALDGVRHTVWRIADAGPFLDAFRSVPHAYVADGHHRSASAWRAGRELRNAPAQHRGDGEYNWFLAVLFPAEQLRILPYNRIVRDLGDLGPPGVLARLSRLGRLVTTDEPAPERPGSFGIFLKNAWYRLELDETTIDRTDPIGSLDVSLLQDRVLGPILGVGDPRTDKRIDFVGGIRGTAELERRVRSGEMAIAFSLYPTTVDQLMAVSDAGQIMPPKSTWFEPKLRSGLFVHTL